MFEYQEEALDLSTMRRELNTLNCNDDPRVVSRVQRDAISVVTLIAGDEQRRRMSDSSVIKRVDKALPSKRTEAIQIPSLPSPRSMSPVSPTSPPISVSQSSSVLVSSADRNTSVREMNGIQLCFHDTQLWSSFNKIGTEMIINRGGRRMFPHVTVSVQSLEKSVLYDVFLEVFSADDRRFKFINNNWIPISLAEVESVSLAYLHPDSPNTGTFWEQNKISFAKMKLTNNKDSVEGNVLLTSMHQYMTGVTIRRHKEDPDAKPTDNVWFPLTETKFMAVTAYQNEMITKLKIVNNPFAKAFRVSQLTRVQDNNQNGKRRHTIACIGETDETPIKTMRNHSLGSHEQRKTVVSSMFGCSSLGVSRSSTSGGDDTSTSQTSTFIPISSEPPDEQIRPVFLNAHLPHPAIQQFMPHRSQGVWGLRCPTLTIRHPALLRHRGEESLFSAVCTGRTVHG